MIAIIIPKTILYAANVNVTTNADSGAGSLRQAIIDINSGSDGSNTINMQIPGNSPISLSSDLPVIKKNTVINSTGKQPIDAQGQYRLFATIMADLTLTNCMLQNGAAIGGNGGGGGMGAGGGIYIDRGNTLILTSTDITSCKARGGNGRFNSNGGGGASFSSANKHSLRIKGGGDFPGKEELGGSNDGSPYLKGYGGGDGGDERRDPGGKGGGNGAGKNGEKGGDGGYCGGDGGYCGGFGSGGGGFDACGGGGFGGGGGSSISCYPCGGAGGGFGGGGGCSEGYAEGLAQPGKGGHYGGDGVYRKQSGGGAGLGGAIFVGDSATCIIQDNTSLLANQAIGGQGGNPGQGYAPDIFVFREAKVIFNNQHPSMPLTPSWPTSKPPKDTSTAA